MKPNTWVTSSQLLFECNAGGQSNFLQKSWTNFVSLQPSSGFYEMSKTDISSPIFVKGTLLTSLRYYLSVFCVREIPHHHRLHWNREAATPARPAHAKPLLGLSPMGISAEGPAQVYMLPSASRPYIPLPSKSSHLNIFNLDPQENPGYCNMIRFGTSTLGSNVKDNAVLFLIMLYQTRWHKGKKRRKKTL